MLASGHHMHQTTLHTKVDYPSTAHIRAAFSHALLATAKPTAKAEALLEGVAHAIAAPEAEEAGLAGRLLAHVL